MLSHTLEHIDEIGIRIDAVQSASNNQALDNADVFSAKFCPAKEPGLAAHGDNPQRALEMIGINRYIGIR